MRPCIIYIKTNWDRQRDKLTYGQTDSLEVAIAWSKSDYLQICSGVTTPPFVVMFLPLLNYISAIAIVPKYLHFCVSALGYVLRLKFVLSCMCTCYKVDTSSNSLFVHYALFYSVTYIHFLFYFSSLILVSGSNSFSSLWDPVRTCRRSGWVTRRYWLVKFRIGTFFTKYNAAFLSCPVLK